MKGLTSFIGWYLFHTISFSSNGASYKSLLKYVGGMSLPTQLWAYHVVNQAFSKINHTFLLDRNTGADRRLRVATQNILSST